MTANALLVELVQSCLDTCEIDKRIEILERINQLLPKKDGGIELPFFITNDYIDRALGLLEELMTFDDNIVLK